MTQPIGPISATLNARGWNAIQITGKTIATPIQLMSSEIETDDD